MPPIYVITLRETPDRLAKSKAYFDGLGLNYKFFYGFYGDDLGIQTTEPRSDYTYTSSGKLSLVLGHLALYRAMLLTDQQEFLVVEDDCFFVPNFAEEFAQSYQALPSDWEMAYLGYCCVDTLPKHEINNRIAVYNYPLCTHAILYKRSVINTILNKIDVLCEPIDIALHTLVLPYVKCYCFDPQLANQRTITGEWAGILP
jgi:GR25 family glycosyltransferase involved in LPS biosynthesis